jgi:hypothetical protein
MGGNLVDYGEQADLGENASYLAWGAGLSLLAWTSLAFGSAFATEWSDWRREVGRVRRERLRQREEWDRRP